MKSQREIMIDELIDEVENWDWQKLVVFVRSVLFSEYGEKPTNEIEEEYVSIFGVKDEIS
jgi:hypothetical protein